MDIITLALAKKFAKEYIDTHASKITEEDIIQAVANYFNENPNAIVTNDELTSILENYSIDNLKFTNQNATTIAVGGIPKGSTFTDKSIKDILQAMLYPYVAFTYSSVSGGGTYEYGTQVTVNTVRPSYTAGSMSLTLAKVGTVSGSGDLYDGAPANTITLTTPKTYNGENGGTIYVTLSDGTTTITRSTSVTYTYYDYYAINSSSIAPSTGIKGNSGNKTYTVGNYLWFFSQNKANAKIQTNVMGQWVNVNTTAVGQIDFTLASGKTTKYYAYRTDQFSGSGSAEYRLS